jgi:hypothetical protein
MGAVTAAVIGGAILAGGSYAASQESKKGADAQRKAAEEALKTFKGIPIPTIEEQQLILQNPDLVGQYTPEQVQAMELMTSKMEGVNVDQKTIDAQNSALEGIGEIAEGGYSEGDKATAREIQRNVSQDSQARQKSILNAMASRGVLGSGMELAAQLQGNQQAEEQMSRGGEALTQQAQARALQALGQQGGLAGQMRSQEYGELSDKARAADAINQFNTQNRQNVANTNVGERNRAQLLNLQQRQSQEDQRAALANQSQIHNKGLIQAQFNNRSGVANQISNAQMAVGNAQNAAAQANAAGIQGVASAVGSGVMGLGGMMNSNSQAKDAQTNANQQSALNRQNALDIEKVKRGY